MKPILPSIILSAIYACSFAQTDSAKGIKKYVPNLATIHTMQGKTLKGWFYRVDDEHVFLLPAKARKLNLINFKNPNLNDNTINIDIEQIRSISLRKKNSVLKGTLIGFGVGAITGVVIGLASGDDPVQQYYSNAQDPLGLGNLFVSLNNAFAMTAGEKALGGAIGLGASGAIIGAIIGVIAKKKFIIGGKREAYRDLQDDLMKRLIIK